MPWKETCTVDLREKFIDEWKCGEVPIVRLAELHGISRKTAYKWIDRFNLQGLGGLTDRSRAPKTSPHAIEADVAELVVAIRSKHPFWGPRKLLAWMENHRPQVQRPAASTVGDLLKRRGLVRDRRRRERLPSRTAPFAEIAAPNDTWCTDFKGEFLVGGREYCYPLTLTDAFSRYLLRCTGLRSTGSSGAQPIFQGAFEEYGLPSVIRSDNGPPFGNKGGLSRLGLWFMKLGIRPEYIAPASPQQNGRHERMHWTLKQETALPPRSSFERQQAAFNRFREEYNTERPHEALGQVPPATYYQPSPRRPPKELPDLAYPTSFVVRRARSNGEIQWAGSHVFVSEVLVHETVGLEEHADGTWSVWVGRLNIGLLSQKGTFSRRERPIWSDWSGNEALQSNAGAAPPHPCSTDEPLSPMSPV